MHIAHCKVVFVVALDYYGISTDSFTFHVLATLVSANNRTTLSRLVVNTVHLLEHGVMYLKMVSNVAFMFPALQSNGFLLNGLHFLVVVSREVSVVMHVQVCHFHL